MARTYGRRPGEAGEFARLWDALPAWKQQAMLSEFRAALRAVPKVQDGDTTHPPYRSEDRPFTHAHPHHVSGDRTHNHQHTHYGDALHIGHDHSDIDRAAQSAEQAKQSGARSPTRIMNRATRVATDDTWTRLNRAAAAIEPDLRKGRR